MKKLLSVLIFFFVAWPAHAAARTFAAARIGGEASVTIGAGEAKDIVFKYRNIGTKTWRNAGKGYVSLYSTKPKGKNTLARMQEASVAPGAIGTFVVHLPASEKIGSQARQFQLASENAAWIWSSAARLTVKVVEPIITAATPVSAPSYVAIDAGTGEPVIEHHADEVRSIASITKLMSIMVAKATGLDPDTVVAMERGDEVGGGRLQMRYGTKLKVGDLIAGAVVGSANNSTNALARATGLSRQDFVAKMNEMASSTGLVHTSFTDPTGIEVANVSTAREVAKFAAMAFSDPQIGGLASQPTYRIVTADRHAQRDIANTNKLLKDAQVEALNGKTGFINEAGYTLVTTLRKPGEKDMLIVVLGSATKERSFRDAKAVAERAWAQD
jgi:D-alanyl-D-alanine carboxypeptidase